MKQDYARIEWSRQAAAEDNESAAAEPVERDAIAEYRLIYRYLQQAPSPSLPPDFALRAAATAGRRESADRLKVRLAWLLVVLGFALVAMLAGSRLVEASSRVMPLLSAVPWRLLLASLTGLLCSLLGARWMDAGRQSLPTAG